MTAFMTQSGCMYPEDNPDVWSTQGVLSQRIIGVEENKGNLTVVWLHFTNAYGPPEFDQSYYGPLPHPKSHLQHDHQLLRHQSTVPSLRGPKQVSAC